MLSSNDSVKDGPYKKPLVAQLGPTCIAQGHFPPAFASCQSHQDHTSGKWYAHHTDLPGTFNLGINTLAAASASPPIICDISNSRRLLIQRQRIIGSTNAIDLSSAHCSSLIHTPFYCHPVTLAL